MKIYRYFIWLMLCFGYIGGLLAQSDKQSLIKTSLHTAKKDTTPATLLPVQKKDTLIKAKKHDPRIATQRSAILPGWGQAYNREYWKIPIVYGILAIPAGLYFYNDGYYKKTKFAYEALFKAQAPTRDSSDIPFIAPEVKGLSLESLQSYRNSFRRDRDYSVLWFLIAWGLQVADATVFGHLKQFDVSNDLSMEITPAINPRTKTPALSLTLNLKNPSRRTAITR